MKKVINLVNFILAVFIPGVILFLVSSIFDPDSLGRFVLLFGSLIGLFAAEVMDQQRGATSLWAEVSKIPRDKIVYAISLAAMLLIFSLPFYLGKKSFLPLLIAGLMGFAFGTLIIMGFGSPSLKKFWFSRPKRRNAPE